MEGIFKEFYNAHNVSKVRSDFDIFLRRLFQPWPKLDPEIPAFKVLWTDKEDDKNFTSSGEKSSADWFQSNWSKNSSGWVRNTGYAEEYQNFNSTRKENPWRTFF